MTPSNLTNPANPTIAPGYVRVSAVACTLMILYGLVWEGWVDPIREGSWLWLKVLPLAVALPGLLKGRVYTYQWMSLAIWLYVCEALVRIIGLQWIERLMAWGWLALSLALTAAILLAVRDYKRQAARYQAELASKSASPETP